MKNMPVNLLLRRAIKCLLSQKNNALPLVALIALSPVAISQTITGWTSYSIPVAGGGTLGYQVAQVTCRGGINTDYLESEYRDLAYTPPSGPVQYASPIWMSNDSTTFDGKCTSNYGKTSPVLIEFGAGAYILFNYLENAAALYATVAPKYIVLGVSYAPPGNASSAQYTNSETTKTTQTVDTSFSNNVTVSVTAGLTILGTGGSASSSYGYTQTADTSNAVSVSQNYLNQYTVPGVGNSFSPVNHDDDVIWLWLNPVAIFTAGQNGALVWNGYRFDQSDPLDDVHVIGVLAGYLNGHISIPPSISNDLARTWAPTTLSGGGPALTTQDYLNILAADPLASPGTDPTVTSSSYVPTLGVNGTTTDGRFTQAADTTSFYYEQAGPQGSPIKETYTAVNTNENVITNTNTYQNEVDISATGNFSILKFTAADKMTWTTKKSSSTDTTSAITSSLTIVGPPCSGTSTTSCTPEYAGPAEFSIFVDNLWGSFMFYPHQ